MTHPLFRKEFFVETAFAKRFQAMLRYSWHKRSWHVIVADPGSGKTVSIRDMAQRVGSPAMLAVTAPKNIEDEQALGDQLFAALGLKLTGHWRTRKPKLMGHLHHSGTAFLVVDDAHDLSFEHLMFIKELTDQGRLQYGHPLGLCLVAAGRGNTIPLKETLDQPDPTWLQFRRRFDKLEPFCRIAGHTSEEVREILETLETIFQPLFPQLNLRKWTSFIYASLTQPFFDPTKSGRVTMDYLMKLVTTALEWSYAEGDTEVRAEKLERAVELLVLRRNTLWIIDGAGPSIEDPPSESTEQGNGTESEQKAVPTNVQAETGETVEEQAQTSTSPNCMFSGKLVPIDLKRFTDSGINLVECPDCGRMRSLSPVKGVLRFKAHTRRKQQTPLTEKRWSATGKTDWDVVGG
jgi:AAA domain